MQRRKFTDMMQSALSLGVKSRWFLQGNSLKDVEGEIKSCHSLSWILAILERERERERDRERFLLERLHNVHTITIFAVKCWGASSVPISLLAGLSQVPILLLNGQGNYSERNFWLVGFILEQDQNLRFLGCQPSALTPMPRRKDKFFLLERLHYGHLITVFATKRQFHN